MIHAKIMIIDGAWAVVGTSNLDNRSFGLNDEVNVAIADSRVAARLTQDFEGDLSSSQAVSLQRWQSRSIYEPVLEWVGWVVQSQQ